MLISKNSTIAIIDSGIGGISILKQFISKYQKGNYLYFADNLYMPYGNKTKSWLNKRLDYIINILKTKYKADYIIIACNTASTSINKNKYFNIFTMEFEKHRTYLATKLTKKNLPNLDIIADTNLAKYIDDNIFKINLLEKTIKNHIQKLKLFDYKEVVLGCTHYELVKDLFNKKCPQTKFVNNSEFIVNKINFNNISNDLNIVVLLSKNDEEYRNKLYKIIRS